MTMKTKFEEIIKRVLPNFKYSFKEGKNCLGGGTYLAIGIYPIDININDVAGQKPQLISLCFEPDTMELYPQIFGGNGGQTIHREPNLSDPSEKYLWGKSIRIAFRKPQPNEKAVLNAFEKFVLNYKKALTENMDVLKHRDIVDFKTLLNQ